MGRRKSVDSLSSSSFSSSDSDSSREIKKDKRKKEDKHHQHQLGGHRHDHGNIIHSAYAAAAALTSQFQSGLHASHNMSDFPSPTGLADEDDNANILEQVHGAGGFGSPPAYQRPPPSGYRVPLTTDQPFPTNLQDIGQPPFHDADGVSPIYIGSALMQNSVHPCKIGPHLRPYVAVPYGGGEHGHNGRYDLLPFSPHEMEWVQTSHGKIPQGRRPVEGGYEDNGAKLYHAVADINGLKVPGKAGEHLGGARISFGGREYEVSDHYEILLWK